jgi:hypothetical protein
MLRDRPGQPGVEFGAILALAGRAAPPHKACPEPAEGLGVLRPLRPFGRPQGAGAQGRESRGRWGATRSCASNPRWAADLDRLPSQSYYPYRVRQKEEPRGPAKRDARAVLDFQRDHKNREVHQETYQAKQGYASGLKLDPTRR